MPVGCSTIKETVNGILRKTAINDAGFSLYIHASVGEHKIEQIAEDIHDRYPLGFAGIALEKKLSNKVLIF